MNKLGLPGMKSLDQLRSLSGSVSGTVKTFPASSRSQSDSFSSSGFANLKLTAEKLAKEQASVKTCLEMANSKLKKSSEQIHLLEEKLQNAINENAKLSVKQNEDAKLWKGLESKFSSTKTLCDQLTETLQQLAGQVRDAEQHKKLFEEKLSASSKAFESLHLQMNDLSVKLESSEQTIRNREQELMELRIDKEEMEKTYGDEHCRAASLIKDKESVIKQLEETVAAEKLGVDSLNFQLKEMHLELSSKEDNCKVLRSVQESLETEKNVLQSSNEESAKNLLISGQEIKRLEELIQGFGAMLIELDKQSLAVSNKVVQLNSAFGTCYKLSEQEKSLATKLSQCQFDQLHGQFLHVIAEKDSLQSINEGLNGKVLELQQVQEFVMVQHSEECRLAEEKIRRLEYEAKTLVSKKTELEMLVTKLEEKIKNFIHASNQSENKMEGLLLKISTLESENLDIQEKSRSKLLEKADKIETLEKEIGKHLELVDSLEKQVSQLHDSSKEKEQQLLQSIDRGKELEDKKEEIQSQLAVAESKLVEAKKQYDLMLESKQLELSKHLKEISQRNDQAINDIRRKYEVEKLEIVNQEKEKADRFIEEMERKCDLKIAESKEESRQYLMHVQEEHVALINRIQLEHDKKELGTRADHNEELKRIQIQNENELKEKTMLLSEELEVQMEVLRRQHEDECAKLQEELDLQKSKEERQRALLQLQWKVMSHNPQEDQEVNSKEYSISSIKMRNTDDVKGSRRSQRIPENIGKDSTLLRSKQTPESNVLKKVDKVNAGSIMAIPKHGKKVTHHEYEVETSNGRTITKRRKTSTVMFGVCTHSHKNNHKQNKMTNTPKTTTRKDVEKVVKRDAHSRHSNNIGDLFLEGSLNPYTEDPYAFD
ncbi:synaptonemal complex protein 1-like isoform X2 [Macadamia integrifolia]|uniref:synaptonemal complex protein 1-like isoform X2 n=1 Tax=Macadamia integrifolia TaxID=60698 RepID=UPI001C4E7A17|nr:synaptonemal complex protein 1-like isoform X2 [Macadamia integrifolia]